MRFLASERVALAEISMREIKFRARDTKNNCWAVTIDFSQNPLYWADKMEADYVYQQFTGLKDKSGREIYEGDILKSEQYPFYDEGKLNYVAEVVFEEGCFSAVLSLTPVGAEWKNGAAEGNTTSGEGMSKLEVIGNIYENPELLK